MQAKSEERLELSARLVAAREKHGLTQADVASKWGISGNYVYLIESGKKPFSKKLIPKLLELESDLEEKSYRSESLLMDDTPGKYQGSPVPNYDRLLKLRIKDSADAIMRFSPEETRSALKDIIRDAQTLLSRMEALNSEAVEAAVASSGAAEALAEREIRESRLLPRVGEPSAGRPLPSRGTSQHQKPQQSPPKEAPVERKGESGEK